MKFECISDYPDIPWYFYSDYPFDHPEYLGDYPYYPGNPSDPPYYYPYHLDD